ncbi:DNA-binding protein [Salmonella sp. NCTC 11881]|nr:DNA-binding protein [Salmonella sp. NCTC 11881]
MARPKTQSERMIILERIIGLVKEQGRITTNDVVAIFGVHRTTAEKYLAYRAGARRLHSSWPLRHFPRPACGD